MKIIGPPIEDQFLGISQLLAKAEQMKNLENQPPGNASIDSKGVRILRVAGNSRKQRQKPVEASSTQKQ
jgi:hypothetical protein